MGLGERVPARRRQRGACLRAIAFPLALITLALAARAGLAEDYDRPAPSRQVFEQLEARVKDMQNALAEHYGQKTELSKLPREIGNEVDFVLKQYRDRSNEARDLDERWASLASEEKHRKSDAEELDRKGKQFDQETAALNEKFGDHYARNEALRKEGSAHNARYGSVDDKNAAAVAAYNKEAAELEGRQRALQQEQRNLEKERDALNQRREQLIQTAAKELKERIGVLAKKRAALNHEMIAFMGRCQQILPRITAAAMIAGRASSGGRTVEPYKNQQALANEVVEGLTKNIALEGFKKMAINTELPGLAISAIEVATTGVDARTKEVERSLLLVGDYGLALKQLKQEGRLKKDDPGYEALRQMLADQKEAMPRDKTDIILQGLTSVDAICHALASAAGEYAGSKVKTAGTQIMKRLSHAERKALGKGGYEFFKEAINWTAAGGATSGVETGAKAGAEDIRKTFEHLYEPRGQKGADQ